jgi:archaeal flagellar protein FlaI
MTKIIAKYRIESNFVPADVEIIDDENENVPIYKIIVPELDLATKSLINSLLDELAQKITIDVEQFTDQNELVELKKKFLDIARTSIQLKFPSLNKAKINFLSGILLNRMYGLGEIELFLADDFLEEVVINSSNVHVAVYHKKYGWLKTSRTMDTEDEIYNIASQIGRKVNRSINSLNPIMDAHLTTGDRVAATLFPISTLGNTITIRKFARSPWTMVSLIKSLTLPKEIAAFLWLALEYELNILVAGATASGKTSLVNALSSLMPPTQRIVSIEDTREISLPESLHWNWVPLTTRSANPEGRGEVTMQDLMVASLRMRPDRIIIGEVRRREQAETMFEAMHTGHSVYTTMHADTVQQIVRRLLEPPIAIPRTEAEALQLLIVQFRDRRRNIRRTLELAEVLQGGKETLDINYIYRWRPRTDTFEKVNTSIRVYEDLNLHTGMTQAEIEHDLANKQEILQWLVDFNIDNINHFGQLMMIYYRAPNIIISAAKERKDPMKLIKDIK